jgi:hypothetical protein
MWEKKHPRELKQWRTNLKRQNTIRRKRFQAAIVKAGGFDKYLDSLAINQIGPELADIIYSELD